jgi:surfeit locus 1 family protein
LPLQPFVIQQVSDDGDKLVRDWPAPTTGVERNYGYMFQWWGMAVAAVGFGLYAARRAAKKDQRVLDVPPDVQHVRSAEQEQQQEQQYEQQQKQDRESTRGV